MFRIINIRAAQHSDVEPIVQGITFVVLIFVCYCARKNFRSSNFRMILYNTKISTILYK